MANSLVVLDFETTGLSPQQGDRAIEIGAVKLVNGEVVDSFQALMNPGRKVSGFIEDYTGISNEMLASAKPNAEVMEEFCDFISGNNLLAHNASFDQKFLDAELAKIGRSYQGQFVCSLLTSRRIYQDAPNHKLGTLIRYKGIIGDGSFHRALYDAQMTAKLWQVMLLDIEAQLGEALSSSYQGVPFSLIQKIANTPKAKVAKLLASY
ncbi:3'-5' exonuclease [Thalassotalea sp. LPB0316]|uniref:3'-5' exonuclease n=1 Tax=Thalassotalea sp. LPB0316 TaxID=2769490 RepID=UPI0018673E5E|nr:3'-5' exonuclease [Thalassotalea sp. LPB0316]QOL24654.1 3'-5' exonuclease [Thalassotalea sp. LPB0316]